MTTTGVFIRTPYLARRLRTGGEVVDTRTLKVLRTLNDYVDAQVLALELGREWVVEQVRTGGEAELKRMLES
jgi:hypothetical protein